MKLINPTELGAPKGYSHGVLVPTGSRLLFVAGQIGWNESQEIVGDGFVEQFEQAIRNVLAVVRDAGGEAKNLARLTIYVCDRSEYLAELAAVGEAYRRVMGRHFPAMALVEVQALLEPRAKVEIEATAALPSHQAP